MPLDLQLVLAVQRFFLSAPWTIALAVFLARWLIVADVFPAIWLVVSRKAGERHAVLEAAWSGGLALLVTSVLSRIVMRPRPFLAISEVVRLIPPPYNASFPSGHTATAIAIACALWFGNRKAGLVAFAIAIAVMLGRVASGVHYPTDLLGGIAVGTGSFAIVRFIHHGLHRRDIARSAKTHHHSA